MLVRSLAQKESRHTGYTLHGTKMLFWAIFVCYLKLSVPFASIQVGTVLSLLLDCRCSHLFIVRADFADGEQAETMIINTNSQHAVELWAQDNRCRPLALSSLYQFIV